MFIVTRIRICYFWGNIGVSCLSALLFIVWSFYKSGFKEIFSSLENISGLFFGSIGIAFATFIILWFVWLGLWAIIGMIYCLIIIPGSRLARTLKQKLPVQFQFLQLNQTLPTPRETHIITFEYGTLHIATEKSPSRSANLKDKNCNN